MTAFAIVCAVMLAAVLLWTTLPLWRPKPSEVPDARSERRAATVVVALAVPALATAMYLGLSNWDWRAVAAQAASEADVDQMVSSLERKLADNPKNVEGWLMLGRSYAQLSRFARAADAYQQAYDQTDGDNMEAMVGLGEALTMIDEASLGGRAGELFEAALRKSSNHPKALWYGGMAALQRGDLQVGRDRLQLLLQAQNLPEQMRAVLERQINELNLKLGGSGAVIEGATAENKSTAPRGGTPAEGATTTAAENTPASRQPAIRVVVKIAPQIQQQLSGALPLFILARDPAAGGPPLAVQRHNSTQAPITTELTERDAMIPSRTIATVPRVQVVARISRSGAPQAQSGDFFGEASYEFAKNTGTLQITIDQTVP